MSIFRNMKAILTSIRRTFFTSALALLVCAACSPREEGLILRYDFSKSEGTVLKDVSGNGFDQPVVDNGINRPGYREVGGKDTACQDTDEQGGINFLCDERQNDRYQRRYQGPACCIHIAYIFSFCFAAKYGGGHGNRYQSNDNENAKPSTSEICFGFHNPSPSKI